MTDTQWPRFIVFQQSKTGTPHEYAGSVHASDPEMALLNARDVFVRRPACVSLWLVPAAFIVSRTSGELAQNPAWRDHIINPDQTPASYCIFQKMTHKSSVIHLGDLSAASPELALKSAFAGLASAAAVLWWVLPMEAIYRSTPEDIEVLFAPAATKDYRDQSFFHTTAIMQKIKTQEIKK